MSKGWRAGFLGYWGTLLSSGGALLGFVGWLPGEPGVLGRGDAGLGHVLAYVLLGLLPIAAGIALLRRRDSVARGMAVGVWGGLAVIATLPLTGYFLLIATVPGAFAIVFLGPPLYFLWLGYWYANAKTGERPLKREDIEEPVR